MRPRFPHPTVFFLITCLTAMILSCPAYETVWELDPGSMKLRAGAKEFKLVARGDTKVKNGILEINGRGRAPQSSSGAALVRLFPDFLPPGRFGIEVCFRAEECSNQYQYIIDTQYNLNAKENNGGFCLFLLRQGNKWQPVLSLGLGTSSHQFKSAKPKLLEPGREYKLSAIYDGISKVSFHWENQDEEIVKAPFATGAVHGPGVPLVIGDHYRANYQPLHGALSSLRIRIFSPAIEQKGPRAFHSFSGKRPLKIVLSNNGDDWNNVTGTLKMPFIQELVQKSGPVPSGKSIEQIFEIDTRLMPGKYEGLYSFSASNGDKGNLNIEFEIGKSDDKHRFPVIIWNHGNYQCDEHYVPYGVTHTMKWLSAAPDMGKTADFSKGLDKAVTMGISVFDQFLPPWGSDLQYYRIDRAGKRYALKGIDFMHPKIKSWMKNYADRVLENYGEYPAWAGSIVLTELRDATNPSYSGYEQAAYKAQSGHSIPDDINSRIHYDPWKIPGVLDSGTVDFHNPILEYYRWFWANGDGYNPTIASISDKLHKGRMKSRPDFMTVSDPAVRVPPIWGNGAGADALHHWVYTYFTPPKIVKIADELFAMSEGSAKQKVFTSAQGIWYRKWVAPLEDKIDNPPEWSKQEGADKYTLITIPPDILEEALYLQLMRPICGIMMYDYGCVFGTPGYKVTNTNTRERFKNVVHNVVKPLGPALSKMSAPKAGIAMLQSFPAAVLAQRGEYGWGDGWETRVHVALQFAGYHAGILYEEHLRKNGLDGVKVLLLMHCDVLSKDIAEMICRFQNNGGIVVADEYCPPSIIPDITISSQCGSWPDYSTPNDPVRTAREINALSEELSRKLLPFIKPESSFSVPGVSTCLRGNGAGACLIAVNDNRSFGNYIGQYGRMCEKHNPVSGEVSVNMKAGAIYDLVKNKEMPFRISEGKTHFELSFEEGPGRIIMLLPEQVGGIENQMIDNASRGGKVSVQGNILGISGKTLNATIPVRFAVFLPDGKRADAPEYSATENGAFSFAIPLPVNAPTGEWRVEITELCSGRNVSKTFVVK